MIISIAILIIVGCKSQQPIDNIEIPPDVSKQTVLKITDSMKHEGDTFQVAQDEYHGIKEAKRRFYLPKVYRDTLFPVFNKCFKGMKVVEDSL